MADGSAVKPAIMAETAESSEVAAGVANATLESGTEKPAVPGEQTTLLEVSGGMVEHAVWPLSPQVAPPAMEEDEVEEIEHEES